MMRPTAITRGRVKMQAERVTRPKAERGPPGPGTGRDRAAPLSIGRLSQEQLAAS